MLGLGGWSVKQCGDKGGAEGINAIRQYKDVFDPSRRNG